MPQLDRILFPIDFSSHCVRAGREIFLLARQLDAEVVLLHVLESPDATLENEISDLQLTGSEAQTKAVLDQLNTFLKDQPEGVSSRSLLVHGKPADEVLKAIHSVKPDFVAMPTRGLGFLESLLFGSVTERVLHHALCPVWTEGLAGEGVARYEDILCCLDLGPDSTAVLAWAGLLARRLQANLRLLHVGHGAGALVELRRLQSQAELSAECLLRPGEVTAAILQEAERSGTDLLVIGRGAERHLAGRFRSHAQTIIRQSKCAVLSV